MHKSDLRHSIDARGRQRHHHRPHEQRVVLSHVPHQAAPDFGQMKQEILSKIRHKVCNQQKGVNLSLPEVNTSPFVDEIFSTTFPSTFRMPNISMYDDKGDPKEYIALFRV